LGNSSFTRLVLNCKFCLLAAVFFFWTFTGFSQGYTITGRVVDAKTGDPVPFANIYLKGSNIGTTSDFVGYYTLQIQAPADSLVASYIGYITRTKYIKWGVGQVIDFQLVEQITKLQTIVFKSGENPAFPIMRKVVQNKKLNDKKELIAYEFESYNKIELDIDDLSEKFKNRRIFRKVKSVIDSVDQMTGEEGETILPIFISESISKFYFRNNPELQKEHIIKTKITGVGLDDGTYVSQLIGSTFQEYNFYQNWLNILTKEFVSPIAYGWRYYYDVYLIDSLYVGDYFCYRIDVYPKRDQDLAFNGTIWITKEHYALKQIDVYIDKNTNLNYIEKIKIQQELEPTVVGPWIPVKSRVLVNVEEVSERYPGLLAKFYTSNKNWVVNQPRETKFYNTTLEMEIDATESDEAYWELKRHDPLTPTEKKMSIK